LLGDPIVEFFSEKDLDEAGLGSRMQRWRWIKAGKFPKPIQFVPNGRRLYRREDIEAVLAERAADAA
jgi:predicted DNA-binding transcriptional regulator AlpA